MLVRRIRNAILKPWRKVAAFDEYESPVPVGLIGEADFGIRSAPGILLVQSAHHLSGKAFNRAIGSFEKLQHLQNDPNGFEGIPWGASFSESDTFVKVEEAGRVQTFELKTTTQRLGPATVDGMKFSTIDGKFARVMVRYTGKDTHDRILSFLQQQFGPVDQTPGQVAGGAVKFFNWQGGESAIILRQKRDGAGGGTTILRCLTHRARRDYTLFTVRVGESEFYVGG